MLRQLYTGDEIARPDAEKFNRMYLIKKVDLLRATYQFRLLAASACAIHFGLAESSFQGHRSSTTRCV